MAADVPIARADSKKIVECISSDEKVRIWVADSGLILGGSKNRKLTYIAHHLMYNIMCTDTYWPSSRPILLCVVVLLLDSRFVQRWFVVVCYKAPNCCVE